jgi:hypothetical protein
VARWGLSSASIPDGAIVSKEARPTSGCFDGGAIVGATNANYVVQTGDVGHDISVRVTYLDGQL